MSPSQRRLAAIGAVRGREQEGLRSTLLPPLLILSHPWLPHSLLSSVHSCFAPTGGNDDGGLRGRSFWLRLDLPRVLCSAAPERPSYPASPPHCVPPPLKFPVHFISLLLGLFLSHLSSGGKWLAGEWWRGRGRSRRGRGAGGCARSRPAGDPAVEAKPVGPDIAAGRMAGSRR